MADAADMSELHSVAQSNRRVTRWAAGLAVVGALLLGACGNDDGDDEAASSLTEPASATSGPATDETTAASTDETTAAPTGVATQVSAPVSTPGPADAAESVGGEVPDPCSLIPAAELSSLAGGDPGAGMVEAVVPDERKICLYESGLILAVEIADHYDASVVMMKENAAGGAVEEVAGVGSAAVWQDFGGVGQFVARGDRFLVGVTVTGGGKPSAQAIAAAMLAALA